MFYRSNDIEYRIRHILAKLGEEWHWYKNVHTLGKFQLIH